MLDKIELSLKQLFNAVEGCELEGFTDGGTGETTLLFIEFKCATTIQALDITKQIVGICSDWAFDSLDYDGDEWSLMFRG